MLFEEVLVPLWCDHAELSSLVELKKVVAGAYMCSMRQLEDGLEADSFLPCVSLTWFLGTPPSAAERLNVFFGKPCFVTFDFDVFGKYLDGYCRYCVLSILIVVGILYHLHQESRPAGIQVV